MTLAVVEQIGQKIAKGMTEEQACLVLGASYDAFKKAQQRKPAFVLAIKKAQAAFLDRAMDAIADGGETEELVVERLTKPDGTVVEKFDRRVKAWTGLAWILERRHKPHSTRLTRTQLRIPKAAG